MAGKGASESPQTRARERTQMKLHLGLTPWVEDLGHDAAAIAEQAEVAESMGYHSLWLPESHFVERGACPSPLVVLAAAAARTGTLRLATTSYLLPIRNPLQAAEEAAVLDRVSSGRLILGLGRGFRKALFDAFNVPRAEKRDRFEAALGLMILAWSGEPVSCNGGKPVRLSPRPVQEPHPPLWVAAFGPKAVLQAARLGLPYLASPVESMARLQENYALHRGGLAEQAGSRELPVPIMRIVFTSRSSQRLTAVRTALREQMRELKSSPSLVVRRRAPATVDEWALVGEPEAVREGIERYRETLGMTHLIVRGAAAGADLAERRRSLASLVKLLA